MTREEQKQITEFIEHSVLSSICMPSVDFEADAIIRALFVRNPDAAYRITILAINQQIALKDFKDQLIEANAYHRKNWLSRVFFEYKNGRRLSRQPGISSRSVNG